MVKSKGLTLIVVLLLVAMIAAGFIWAQEVNRAKVFAVEPAYPKNMKNLLVRNDLEKYGIEVIASTDASFNSDLKQYIGRDDSLVSLVESARPFTIFIKNNSLKEIVGVSLRWTFSGLNGENFEIPQNEANPGRLMGLKPLDPTMVGKTSLINNKAMKFFTYFNDIVGNNVAFANMRFKNPSINYPYNFYSQNSQSDIYNLNSQKESILSRYNDFSVSVDGIVFDDGTFIGADQNFFFDMLRGDMQARKDILKDLADAKLSGKKDTNILDDILSATSNISVNLAAQRSADVKRDQVFDSSYKTYLKNLRNELVMKRSMMSDDNVVKQLQYFRLSNFIALRKIDDVLR